MKTNSVYRLIVTILIVAGLCFGLARLLDLINSKIEIVRTHKAKELQNESLEYGNQLKTNMATLVVQEQVIKGAFIDEKNTVEFIQKVEDIGSLYGLSVSIDRVQQGEAQALSTGGRTVPVTLTVTAEGPFSQIGPFVQELLAMGKSISLNAINVYEAQGNSYSARMTLTGIMISYE